MQQQLEYYLEGPTKKPETGFQAIHDALYNIHQPVFISSINGEPAVFTNGKITSGNGPTAKRARFKLISFVAPQV